MFYRKGDQLLAVDIAAATSEFTAGRPRPLFTGPYLADTFDVARDGRFLMLKEDERQPITQLNLVQNWFDELKARVPTK